MKARKGFTMVELMIVIVIIGILAGAMLLAGGAATASAEASNIINNFRSLMTASVVFYEHNMEDLSAQVPPAVLANTGLAPNDLLNLTRYTNNPDAPVWGNYQFVYAGAGPLIGRTWWIGVTVNRADIASRLAGRASSLGLYNAAHAAADIPAAPDYQGGSEVFMLLRTTSDS
jgi:prepilin-type N-terminal cleavage/methylation domain-containing protein